MIDTCAPRNKRKSWYRKKTSRRRVKRWLFHPGKSFRRKLPLWMPLSKRRGKIRGWQKPFLLFAVFVDLLAKIMQWILDMLNRDKKRKPLVPIPIPKPYKPTPDWGGGGGRYDPGCGTTSGQTDPRYTCAGYCRCPNCAIQCVYYCRGACLEYDDDDEPMCNCPM